MAIITPRPEINITGADLTGADLASNRTYTISDSNISNDAMRVHAGGQFLFRGASKDWTFDGTDKITFLGPMPNGSQISILYYTSTTSGVGSSLKFSSVLGFVKHIQSMLAIPSNEAPIETVGTGDNSTTEFFLAKIGIIEDTYTLSYGATSASRTDLTEGTHYTLDLDTSKLTLTSAGVTAVGTNVIFAEYKYNRHELLNSEITRALAASENKVFRRTEMAFANFTDTDPAYIKIVNEIFEGGYCANGKTYDAYYQPFIKFQTTVNGAYTTGSTTITLTSGSGLPSTGTIYIGGNKVAYTARSGNDLTIPSATPSIADAATVRGEVVEISREAEGNEPSYTVLDPDTEYKIDYDTGRVMPLSNAFFGELSNNDVRFPANHLIRASYMSAWHEGQKDPFVPEDIEEVTYMICAKKFAQRILKKAHIQGNDDFSPTAINSGDNEIDDVLNYYKTWEAGTSPYNWQSIG